MRLRTLGSVVAVLLAGMLLAEAGDAWARARGGGSRGSRSYSAPAAPSSPSSPSRSFSQPSSPVSPAAPVPQRSGFGRGLLGGIAGFALGGLLGGLLFGGLGHGFGGIGLMDILLIGGGLFLLYRFMQARRQSPAPAYAGIGGGGGGAAVAEVPQAPAGASDIERGLAHIRQMDPGFDPDAFAGSAREAFRAVQTALVMRDMTMIRNRLTPEMHGVLQGQCNELRAAGRSNHIEQMDVERSEITEMWQERGQDFVSVFLAGRLLDYTTDDRSGTVVAGSRTDAEKFEEFWTFTRPVGPNAWKLTAIQSA